MGGVVSAGMNNDELIDKLKEADYIKSPEVEKAFRLVDRGNYLTEDSQSAAYRDNAWRSGNLHISAPCIYAQVMEGLKLNSGMSFLNIGSGTGYLSTLAGLMIGPFGINHGVELHSSVVSYARECLSWFLQNSSAVDVLSFCEPQFYQGNGLCFSVDVLQYDRVYCGASCPQTHEEYMKQLIKVNGILVMPRSDKLIKVTRTGESSWVTETLIPVSFASLVMPNQNSPLEYVSLPNPRIPALQEISRELIRSTLRAKIEAQDEELKNSFVHEVTVSMSNRKKCDCPSKMTFVNISDSENDSEGSDDSGSVLFASRRLNAHHLSAFLEIAQAFAVNGPINQDNDHSEEAEPHPGEDDEGNVMQHEAEIEEEDASVRIRFVRRVGERNPSDRPQHINISSESEELAEENINNTENVEMEFQPLNNDTEVLEKGDDHSYSEVQIPPSKEVERDTEMKTQVTNIECNSQESIMLNTAEENIEEERLSKIMEERETLLDDGAISDNLEQETNCTIFPVSQPNTSSGFSAPKVPVNSTEDYTEKCTSSEKKENTEDYLSDSTEQNDCNMDLTLDSSSNPKNERDISPIHSPDTLSQNKNSFWDTNKREKVDSGIVDDLDTEMDVENYISSGSSSNSLTATDLSSSEEEEVVNLPSTSSPGQKTSPNKRDRVNRSIRKNTSRKKWTRKTDSRKKKRSMKDKRPPSIDSKISMSKYSCLIVEKIKDLPLPSSLKLFVNLNRPL